MYARENVPACHPCMHVRTEYYAICSPLKLTLTGPVYNIILSAACLSEFDRDIRSHRLLLVQYNVYSTSISSSRSECFCEHAASFLWFCTKLNTRSMKEWYNKWLKVWTAGRKKVLAIGFCHYSLHTNITTTFEWKYLVFLRVLVLRGWGIIHRQTRRVQQFTRKCTIFFFTLPSLVNTA